MKLNKDILHCCAAAAARFVLLAAWSAILLLVVPLAQADQVPFRHYGIEAGLPNEDVLALERSADGLLWIGTQTGLAVYDGETFETIPLPESIGQTRVNELAAMPDGSVWVRAGRHGVYEVRNRRFVRELPGGGNISAMRLLVREDTLYVFSQRAYWIYPSSAAAATRRSYGYPIKIGRDPAPEQGRGIVDAAALSDGALWVLDSRRGPGRLQANGTVVFPAGVPPALGPPRWQRIAATPGGAVLLARGHLLYRYEPERGATEVLATTGLITQLSVQTEHGRAVAHLATSEGMHRLDARTGEVLMSLTREEGLPSDKMRCFLQDEQGRTWIGTHNGLVHLFAPGIVHLTEVDGVNLVDVALPIFPPGDALWAYTWGSGLVRLHPRPTVTMPEGTRFWSDVHAYDGGSYALRTDELWRLEEDGRWRKVRGTGDAVRGYVSRDGETGFFWHDDGLYRLELNTDAPPELLYPWTVKTIERTFTLGPGGRLLVRDRDRLLEGHPPDTAGRAWHFKTVARLPGYAEARGRYMVLDGRGVAWISFFDRGLVRVDLSADEPTPEPVVPDRFVTRATLLGDSLALAQADDGLHVIRAATGMVLRHLTRDDGLLATRVNGAVVVSDTLYLGHSRGVTKMPANQLLAYRTPPRTHLARVERNGHRSLLRDTLFTAGERTAGFGFAPTAFAQPGPLRYEYRLLPDEPTWTETDRSFIRYTNLPPGRHRFEVRARYGEGRPGEAAVFAFTIPKYLHETWGFRLFALLMLALGAFGLYRWRVRTMRHRQLALESMVTMRTAELRREKRRTEEQARRLAEIDEAKTRFFANISHEFRTPLTLILGATDDVKNGRAAGTIRRSAHRLLELITQLLDLARLESGRMQMKPEAGDLRSFVEDQVRGFMPLAEREQITLRFRSEEEHLPAVFDPDALQKIISNLLSNALKFTPGGGKVWVLLWRCDADGAPGEVELVVKDTGPGISAEALPHLFDRFYQADNSSACRREGTGIGLALAREMAELCGGSLAVETEEGFGSAFHVRLPLCRAASDEAKVEGDALPAADVDVSAAEVGPFREERDARAAPASLAKCAEQVAEDAPCVLIVDDHPEVRALLRSYLQSSYSVAEASDGAEALQEVRREAPDLVISDVMMPEMDGYELCRRVRGDDNLRQVPVILLTARAEDEDHAAGLKEGADAYLTKPFSREVLRATAKRLVERSAEEKEARIVRLEPGRVEAPSEEEELMRRVLNVAHEHLVDPGFGVGQLADEVGLSKRQLTRRLKALTEETPGALLRRLRLERGKQLLAKRATVAEVAYAVGYSSPSYFSRAFRSHFGESPTEALESAGAASDGPEDVKNET